MGDISPNFNLYEFLESGAAARNGLENIPNEHQERNIRYQVAVAAQPWRDHVGRLDVTGGFVSDAVNDAIRREQYERYGRYFRRKDSRHKTGGCGDYVPAEVDRWYAWGALIYLWDAGKIHVDVAIIYEEKPHIHLQALPPSAGGDNAGLFLFQRKGLDRAVRWRSRP